MDTIDRSPTTGQAAQVDANQPSLAQRVSQIVEKRLYDRCELAGDNIYEQIIEQVESSLLRSVMLHNKNNQSNAAKQLGISRGTLRGKLRKHFGDTYVNLRD